MKEDLKLVKSVKENTQDIVSKPLPPGTLFVVCLNKPLIELWSMKESYSDDLYDYPATGQKSVYSISDSGVKNSDHVPYMLSPEDELLLFNEGLSENY